MQAGELTTEGTFYWMKIKGDTEWKELNEQNGQPSSRCTHQHNALSISKAMILINYLGSSSGQGQWLVVDQWLGVQRHIPHRIKNQGNRWGEEIATALISLRYPFSKRKQPKWRWESAYPVGYYIINPGNFRGRRSNQFKPIKINKRSGEKRAKSWMISREGQEPPAHRENQGNGGEIKPEGPRYFSRFRRKRNSSPANSLQTEEKSEAPHASGREERAGDRALQRLARIYL